MIGFFSFLTESSKGAEITSRGKLNELAFVHAFERYNALKEKHNGDHEKAIQELANEPHLNHETYDGPYSDSIASAKRSLDDYETDRTLWDSHHAAVAVLNYIHKERGGIAGPAIWTGGDVSGETVKKITGVNTQGDILIPTKSGEDVIIKTNDRSKKDWLSGSLKYSISDKASPTKLYQGTARAAAEMVQNHHVRNFGKRDEALDKATDELENAFGDISSRLTPHDSTLNAAGFNRNKKGEYPITELTKISRYANELAELQNKKYKTVKDVKRQEQIQSHLDSHFDRNNIPENERPSHTENLRNIYKSVISGDKKTAGANYSEALNQALKKSWNEASKGQHGLLRDLLNIRERRKAVILVMKTQRSKGDHISDPKGALPKISIANHANDLEALARTGLNRGLSERDLYDNVKNKAESASTTISKRTGGSIANFAIDTSKGSPSLVAAAGTEIDNFKDISKLHPHKNASLPQQRHPDEAGSGEHGGKSFYGPEEK